MYDHVFIHRFAHIINGQGGDGYGGEGFHFHSGFGGGDGGGDGGGGSCTDTEVNGVFCELSNWFQSEVPESESVDAPVSELNQQSLDSGIFSSNAQCPSDVTLNMPIGARNFTYTFSFSIWCYWLGVLGSFILIAAYCFGAYIVVSKS